LQATFEWRAKRLLQASPAKTERLAIVGKLRPQPMPHLSYRHISFRDPAGAK
jgi:hypothetical protein